jgi:hypothetical protein
MLAAVCSVSAEREVLAMNIHQQIGRTAGDVWHLLHQDGPRTLAQLKRELDSQAEFLPFAIGWLAREDKIDIVADKKSLRVQLK